MSLRIGFDIDGTLADFSPSRVSPETIRDTPDFWSSLAPIDPEAVRRIHELTLKHRWDVFFITQRPTTQGDTVQRQTQRWLVQQGFEFPSVIVLQGCRGAAAAALKLDYLVDDSPANCVDVRTESDSRTVLIAPNPDALIQMNARRLEMTVVATIGDALDLLNDASAKQRPDLMQQLSTFVGWQ